MQSIWADRVAPQLPSEQTLVSGTPYYLYNVIEGKFLCRSTTNSSYVGLGTYGDKVIVTATANENEYTIQWANNNYYLAAFDTYIYSYSYSDSYSKFTIATSSKGYTIQRSTANSSYYKVDEFIGYNGSNGDRLTPALAEGSIHWILFSVDEAEYYMAKHKLYTYLEVADQYNFYVTQYNLVYDNGNSTTAELDFAQSTLANALEMSKNYVSPSWTEYPILFQNSTENKWECNENSDYLYWDAYSGSGSQLTSTLTATVNVDNNATMAYTYYTNSSYTNLRVFVDGELVQNISNNVSLDRRRYYIELSPGKHDISWTCVCNDTRSGGYYNSSYLKEIGIQNTPTISPATTTTEGQLGTEILKLIDPISGVKKIVINGIIGSDDWTTIGLMVNAFSIDMSGATATAPMPDEMFKGSKFPFLHDVKLPQGLTAIGRRAFSGSDVENDMVFPASLQTIGEYAFYNSKLKGAQMQDGVTSIGNDAFENSIYLENVTFPATAATIPSYCFQYCRNLRTFTIPEGVKKIGQSAFEQCSMFNARFPSTIESIGYSSFYNTATDSLFVSEKMTVNSYAFSHCNNLVYAEWPTCFAQATGSGSSGTSEVVTYCPKLNKVKLMSPTVVTYGSQDFFNGNTLSNITLLVPDFLESAYKLDPYWYQCNVQSFDSETITDWSISQSLTLNPGQRIGGTPNMHFSGQNANFTVNGDDVQTIGDLSVNYNQYNYYYYTSSYSYYVNQQWGMMLGNTDKVNITGGLSENVLTEEKKWYFMTLPFDTKVGDITTSAYDTETPTSYAIRYYDGSSRATNGSGSNWKDYNADDIIPAGTGFIYQTAKAAKSKFVSQNNATKQYILSNKEFVKTLEKNPSEVAANKGWNLVGNPWQTYYNIHKLNFTAPITVWDSNNRKYAAYSIIDDDYAIKPLEAIFVQCPDEISTISFPIDGRQLTDVIESQSGARAKMADSRMLIDVELSDGEVSDKTRFVMNPEASFGYETACDASKFMSLDASVPQLWTVEQNTKMAINERPMGEAPVQLGFSISKGGEFTISAPRCEFDDITLVDTETGIETNLAKGGSYNFTADAGVYEKRFILRVGGTSTGIETFNTDAKSADEFYNLNGQRIAAPQKGIVIMNGKKVVIK